MQAQTLHMKRPRSQRLACAVAACSIALAAPVAAHAAASTHAAPTSYVALGDSYTSSPMTGVAATGVPGSCMQTTDNYPHLVAADIQAPSFIDVSCSGAVIANMTEPQTNVAGEGTNPPQFSALTPSTTLVTVGIGANDANVVGAALNCAEIDRLHLTGSDCLAHYTVNGIDQISAAIDQTAPTLAAAYQSIHASAPTARVLAVGYPDLMPVNGTSCPTVVPISPSDVSWVNAMIVQLNQMIATTAAANDVQYVDTYTPTIGHDVCQSAGIAAFTGVLPIPMLDALHPNELGQELMADAVLEAIAHPPTPAHSVRAVVHLRLTRTAIRHSSVTASGTISPDYVGRVAITFQAHYRRHAIDLHAAANVSHGRLRATLRIPAHYRGVLHAGTLIATSRAEEGLAADTARARIG